MEKLILIMLMTTSVSFTISVTSIFSGFREWVSKIHPKLEELIFCPYCLSHYIALFFLWVSDYRYVFTQYVILNYVFTMFAITAVVAILHYVCLRTYEPVAKNMLFRKMNKDK